MKITTINRRIENTIYRFDEEDLQKILKRYLTEEGYSKKGGEWGFDWDDEDNSLMIFLYQHFCQDIGDDNN